MIMNVEVIELKGKKPPFAIILQFVFVLAVLVTGIMALFANKWMFLLYASLTLALVTMAWNNYKLGKQKWIPILYLAFSLITFVSFLMELL